MIHERPWPERLLMDGYVVDADSGIDQALAGQPPTSLPHGRQRAVRRRPRSASAQTHP